MRSCRLLRGPGGSSPAEPAHVGSHHAAGMAEDAGAFDFDQPRRIGTMAVSVRLRAYRQRSRVRSAYAGRCLYTGRGSVVNGRYECDWSHWMSVAEGGPDAIANTSLVSRTAHFYVEQGHLSLDETYGIIGSDIALDDVRRHNPRLLPWLPLDPADWPSQTYLAWHRARCRRAVPSWMS